MRPIKVLIVDDSPVVRKVLSNMLESDPMLHVVGTAPDANIAVKKIKQLQPDVLTLDVQMPKMDGLTFLERLMKSSPLPVVMVSSLTGSDTEAAFKALELGAVEIVEKPRLGISEKLPEITIEVVNKIKAAAQAKVKTPHQRFLDPSQTTRNSPSLVSPSSKVNPSSKVPASAMVPPSSTTNPSSTAKPSFAPSVKPSGKHAYGAEEIFPGGKLAFSQNLIAIGASTGGVDAIIQILTALPASMPGIVVVQHMPALFTSTFAQRLDKLCALDVKEAETGDCLQPGQVLLAPGSHHLLVKRRQSGKYSVYLDEGPLVNRHRPSVDVLFESVAKSVGHLGIGVLLTGMGSDGANGLLSLKKVGGRTVVQDEASSVVFGMPKSAIQLNAAEHILGLPHIATQLIEMVRG